MNIRTVTIAALAAGCAAAPMLGVAADSSTALNSCVKAFMADLSSHSATALKLREAHYVDDAVDDTALVMAEPTDALTLLARDAHDNHTVGRAICTVNSHGEVVALRAAGASSY